VIVRVLAAPRAGSTVWPVEVLEPLRGASAGPLSVHAAPGGCGAEGRPLAPGEIALLLLSRGAAGFHCDQRYRASHVALAPAERGPAGALVRGLVAALEDDRTGSEAFAAFLRERVTLPNPELRRAVLFDLAPRLDRDDVAFLLRLTGREQPQDVRAWAVVSLAGKVDTLPPEVAALLAPDESESVREAVLQLLGARRRAEDLPLFERALGDGSAALRRVAVENLTVPEAVPLLLARFEREPDPAVQAAIVRKLGTLGGGAAADGLASIAARTGDAALQREAELALAALREREGAERGAR
jgi:HEAT repeat protein